MGSQGVTFPRGICMLIEDTGNPGTASRSQMKEVLKVEERGGSAPRGPAAEATLSWAVWMAAGLGARASPGEYQADEQSGVARLSWLLSSR